MGFCGGGLGGPGCHGPERGGIFGYGLYIGGRLGGVANGGRSVGDGGLPGGGCGLGIHGPACGISGNGEGLGLVVGSPGPV